MNIKEVGIKKNKFQIFTPNDVAEEMLDQLGFKGKAILNKTIYESSCGNGNLLLPILKRLIKVCRRERLDNQEIKKQIEHQIYGAEKDPILYLECIKNLNSLCEKYKVNNVEWKIVNGDGLSSFENVKFDFIVGNPPYIRYHNLSEKLRNNLKKTYVSCRGGSFDYYFAFVENAFNRLNPEGRMTFLLPGSCAKTKAAASLRELLNSNLTSIYDFRNKKIFGNINTSSIIINVNKNKQKKTYYIKFHDSNIRKKLKKPSSNNKWNWSIGYDENKRGNNKIKFNSLFIAHSPIATQANDVFVLDQEKINDYKIEKSILITSGAPKSLKENKNSLIIFPYKVCNDEITKYSEEEITTLYPNAMSYLRKYKTKLLMRDSDKNSKWFEYGRSQSLKSLYYPKLVISTSFSDNTKIFYMPTNSLPSGGIVIKSISNLDLNVAKNILKSEDFFEYSKIRGDSISGDYVRINSTIINEFTFEEKRLNEWLK